MEIYLNNYIGDFKSQLFVIIGRYVFCPSPTFLEAGADKLGPWRSMS
jgi:hypothetical protein